MTFKYVFMVIIFLFVSCASENYDLIVRNGTIVDGSGSKGYKADIGVSDGKIVAIDPLKKKVMPGDRLCVPGLSIFFHGLPGRYYMMGKYPASFARVLQLQFLVKDGRWALSTIMCVKKWQVSGRNIIFHMPGKHWQSI